jgi:hypothetical protein
MAEILPDDAHWMRLALEQAALAAQAGEVPVGAVVVLIGSFEPAWVIMSVRDDMHIQLRRNIKKIGKEGSKNQYI